MSDHKINGTIQKSDEVNDRIEKSRGVRDRIIKSSRINYVPRDMVMVFETTTANEDILLPLTSNSGVYDFTVDWGNGSSDTITAWDDPAKTHTYASAGTHRVKLRGTVQRFDFVNFGDSASKLLEIERWGPFSFGPNGANAFRGCTQMNVTADDTPDLSQTTQLTRAFQNCPSFTGQDTPMNEWDVSNVQIFTFLFWASGFNADISGWDLSSAERFNWSFGNCPFNQDITSWDMSNVQRIDWMFRENDAFNQDISGWDMSSCSDFTGTFLSSGAFDQDLGSWDMTAADECDLMFDSSGLSTANYDEILIGWASQSVKSNVELGASGIQYTSAAKTARDTLINTYNWTIDDGGLA
jgi:hypothetical protein